MTLLVLGDGQGGVRFGVGTLIVNRLGNLSGPKVLKVYPEQLNTSDDVLDGPISILLAFRQYIQRPS